MQLKLSENIKRYRKGMELTQEGLAEALGVTIGAVSKWENGGNVPDIMTLMEMANLFNISMDELIGYDMSSKNAEDICEHITNLCHDHQFDKATIEANNALARYPHTFKVLYTCAYMYYLKAYEYQSESDTKIAIDLLGRALAHMSQNTDPDISEYTIKLKIADMYGRIDPEKALEKLKEINYDDCNSLRIARILMDIGNVKESMKYHTIALVKNFGEQYEILLNTSIAVASSGKKADIKKSVELMDTEILILDAYSLSDRINYVHKLKTIALMIKAWWLSCLGEYEDMSQCVKEAYRLASLFDSQDVSSDLSTSIKFYFMEKKSYSYDSLGATAVVGIETLLHKTPDIVSNKNYKHLAKVIECWDMEKGKS